MARRRRKGAATGQLKLTKEERAARKAKRDRARDVVESGELRHKCGPEVLAAVWAALRDEERAVRAFSFHGCLEDAQDWKAMADTIAAPGTKLESLTLRYNGGDKLEAGRLLGASLLVNATLTSLNLRGNWLGDEGVEAIAVALEGNRTLRRLGLTRNKIGPAGFRSFARALRANRTLTAIDLSENRDTSDDEGAVAVAEAVLAGGNLRELCFSDLGRAGTIAATRAFAGSAAMRVLDLKLCEPNGFMCEADDAATGGETVLAAALRTAHGPGRKHLKLTQCIFDDDELDALAGILRARGSHARLTLNNVLVFGDCPPHILDDLCDALGGNETLVAEQTPVQAFSPETEPPARLLAAAEAAALRNFERWEADRGAREFLLSTEGARSSAVLYPDVLSVVAGYVAGPGEEGR